MTCPHCDEVCCLCQSTGSTPPPQRKTTMTEHTLKTYPEFWYAIQSGEKTFEIRKNDRGFQKGDVLLLKKYDPNKSYCGEEAPTLRRVVAYVLSGMGIDPGYVALGLRPPPRHHQDVLDCLAAAYQAYCRDHPDPDQPADAWVEEAQEALGPRRSNYLYDLAMEELNRERAREALKAAGETTP